MSSFEGLSFFDIDPVSAEKLSDHEDEFQRGTSKLIDHIRENIQIANIDEVT